MTFHHPSSELLKKFAEGALDGSLSSVVSAHVEHCSTCENILNTCEQDISRYAFAPEAHLAEHEVSEGWKNISSHLGSIKNIDSESVTQGEIQILGSKFELPRALRKFASKPLQWMPFGNGGRICKLGSENGKSLFLIYLSSNQEVPLHSHAGMEHSYVVSGSYSENGIEFVTGDFSSSSEDIIHAPKAGSEDGCLLLSSIENRLNFIQGWLSPLNGLLWWFLNLRLRSSLKAIILVLTLFSSGGVMAGNLEKSKKFFDKLSIENMNLVDQFYDKNVVFQDPVHKLNGSIEVRKYYEGLYSNVDSIRFEYGKGIESEDFVSLPWKMFLKTKSINNGNEITVDGVSLITFNSQGKAIAHRDYFDMGEFVYERVPILKSVIGYIKKKLSGAS